MFLPIGCTFQSTIRSMRRGKFYCAACDHLGWPGAFCLSSANSCILNSTISQHFPCQHLLRTNSLNQATYPGVAFKFAVLFPATVLVIMLALAVEAGLSAPIFGDAPAGIEATLNESRTGNQLSFFVKRYGGGPIPGTDGNLSISLNGANPLKIECGEPFSDPGATATSGIGKGVPVQVSGNVDTATLGSYTLTYTAVDEKDSTSVERTVTVVDTTAPEIALKGGKTMTVNCGESFTEPGASAIDGCQGSVPVSISGSVDPSIEGRYNISYTAVDASNNTRTVTREVIVGSVEDNPPTIKLVGRAALTIECGNSFSDPGATANTPCSGSVPVGTAGSVDAHTVGSYTLNYLATSGELEAETARTVTVVDTTAPVISLNGDNPLTISRRSAFSDPGATARDACAGEFPAAASGNVDPNTTGSYTISYTASDPSGNQATPVKRTVTVVDAAQAPASQSLASGSLFPMVCKLSGLCVYLAGSKWSFSK